MIGLAAGPPTAAPTRLLLGSSAARSCPVKTHNLFDAGVPRPADESGELPARVQAARAVEAQLLAAVIDAAPGLVADLRLLDPASAAEACRRALQVGAQVVVSGPLPVDPAGHRAGRPALLLRGPDGPDGRPTYRPATVQPHKVLLGPPRLVEGAAESAAPAPPPTPVVRWSPLGESGAPQLRPWDGRTARLGSREGDFLQLAHYHRMLEAAGLAGPDALAAVIGTDTVVDGQPVLAWVDLAAPVVRTFSRSSPDGWRLRSLLARYDHEQQLRVDIARAAAARTGDPAVDGEPLVHPVVQRECRTCPWWPHCRSRLPDDEVSLLIDKGALDVREVLTLRRHGVQTVPQLAAADLDVLLPAYVPDVRHRVGAEGRLRTAARRARMLTAGQQFQRETAGPIPVPAAVLEIDLDVESAADGRIYLWGFLVDDTPSGTPPRYVAFARFSDLDDEAESQLAAEAFGWLRGLVEGPRSVRVYHYSAYEPTVVRTLAARSAEPEVAWAADYTSELVDLYEVVKGHFFGASGLGLKAIAQHAGFRWRDDDPGGLNSQAWFADAVGGPDEDVRARARTRVLEYNEDDVRATAALRAWLRSQ